MGAEDDFAEFFAVVNDGKVPFAWQTRLLGFLLERGRWPDRLAAPTGAGKTSVIDVHVFAVAVARPALCLPRRLAMVVDRRALVDDQYAHALRLAEALAAGVDHDDPVGRVARRLRGMRVANSADAPLVVGRLRGGEPPSVGWREDPCACSIICATPDMWGSRLLFRGYGASRPARPVDAGMLALDSAVVIDEAHLTRQLLDTSRRVAHLQQRAKRRVGRSPLQPVETTATPTSGDGTTVGVLESDLDHDPVLARRLRTPKTLRIERRGDWPLAKNGPSRHAAVAAIADLAIRLRGELGPTVGCFLNTVAAATDVATELSGRALQVELVCGRLRGVDLDRLRARRPELLTLAGDPTVDVLVATQSLEVGVDIDLAGVVSELAPGSALAQRAGRVNRVGARDHAVVTVVIPDDPAALKESGPYSTESLAACLQWLAEREGDPAGLSPWQLRATPPPAAPVRILHRLEPWDAWQLARTNPPLSAEPDLDVWISDDLEPDLDAAVVSRWGLTGDPTLDLPYLRAVPIQPAEAFPVPLQRAREVAARLTGAGHPVYLEGGDGEIAPLGDARLRPASVIIVPDTVPLLRAGIVDAEPTDAADDVAEEAAAGSGRADLRLGEAAPTAAHTAPGRAAAAAAAIGALDVATRRGRDAAADVIRELGAATTDPNVANHLRKVASALKAAPLAKMEVTVLREDDDAARIVCISDLRRRLPDDARQLITPEGGPVPLDAHQAAVAHRAQVIAAELGLPPRLAHILEHAARHHDDGKADRRFQAALGADADTLLAKSGMSSRAQALLAWAEAGMPSGWRHEQLSAAHAARALRDAPTNERELIVRLVGTSHGRGRPDFPHNATDLATTDGQIGETSAALFDLGWWDALIEATDLDYGVWGAAYLETLLRAADVQTSMEGH